MNSSICCKPATSLVLRSKLRDGSLEKLWWGMGIQKKTCKGKLSEKSSCTASDT